MTTISKSFNSFHVASVPVVGLKIETTIADEFSFFMVSESVDKVSISPEGRIASRNIELQQVEVTESRIENFSELANMLGIREKVIADVMGDLDDQERKNFIEATFKAGNQIGSLISTTKILEDKERSEFLAFTANLSNEDLKSFLATVTNALKSMTGIMETAGKLSQDTLSNYLFAASMAGSEVGLLTEQVNYLIDLNEVDSGEVLTEYLAAAVKFGSMVTDFIKGSRQLSGEMTGMISDFVNSRVADTNLINFISVLQKGDEKAVVTIIDMSISLSREETGNLLKAASNAGKDLNGLVEESSRLNSRGGKDLSNFLVTASKAEGRLGLLLEMSDDLDMDFTANLSRVDTVNFLDAAKRADGTLVKLTKIADQLSQTDKSNFLYAAATTTTDFAVFLKQVVDQGDKKSAFLSEAVNHHSNEIEPAAYMQGLLGKEEYENFKVAAAGAGEAKLEKLVDITNDIRFPDRSGFLEIAAAAEETTGEFLDKFQNLTDDEQSMYVELADGLGGDSLKKLVQAVNKTDENYSQFIELAKEMKGNDRSAFSFFLSAAAEAESKDFETFVNFVEELDQKERHSFLRVASTSGHQLGSLTEMAKNVLPMGQKKFVEIFDAASYAGRNLDKFIQSYL